MIVNGKERGFKLTVSASSELARLCPGNKLSNIERLFSGVDDVRGFEIGAMLIVALNKGYEMAKQFETGDKATPLTVEEILSLDIPTYRALMAEAMSALRGKRNIEVEPTKK